MSADQSFRVRGAVRDDIVPPVTSFEIQSKRRLLPGGAREAGGEEMSLACDDLVRVTLTDGFVLWTRADDLMRERGRRDATRGAEGVWEINTQPPERARRTTRGWLGLGIKVLEVFGIDLKAATARALGERLEQRHLDSDLGQFPHGRLYHCSLGDAFGLTPVTEAAPIPTDPGPLLVFIHGTGSSCQGSFGALWDTEPGRTARVELAKRYGDRAFAFEHPSLTVSPIANALVLASALPAGAQLHLVTHSRGGMVGELLCLGERDPASDPLKPALLKTLFEKDRTLAPQLGLPPLDEAAQGVRQAGYAADCQSLAKLLALLDDPDRGLRIGRFVRTACPARGTTLASGRLDRWLSVFGHLAGWAGVGDAMDFVLAVVKERTDPRTLPGLEAMMPGSALTRLFALPDLVTRSDLSVIAGDVQGDSLWGQLKLFIADWFYGSDHDLVVNTGSMYGGIRRPPKGGRYQFDQAPEVNHFNYFTNARSLRWLTAGLARADGTDGGFLSLDQAPQEAPRWREAVQRSARAGGRPQPLAVVIPGMMGSALRVDGAAVWLSYWSLLRGGINRLRLGLPHQVEPTGPIDDYYGPLIECLARSHRVEVFAYDWRQSIQEGARALAARLETWLPEAERAKQPVRLVAHSMGGLLVRAMIADRGPGADLWRRITALRESRLLMLGTPNQGSHEALRWLTGHNPTLVKLSLLDLTQGIDALVDLVRAFPGLLELLPAAPECADFARSQFWEGLKQDLRARWGTADAVALRQARATWKLLEQSPVDPLTMVYVAGHQPATVAGYRLVEGAGDGAPKRLEFLATPRGDGTVTWASGTLPGVPVWYVADTAHDALCIRSDAFAAYLDLLQCGKTTRLPQTPPGQSRAGTGPAGAQMALTPLPDRPPTDDIPGQRAIERLSFGGGLPPDDEGRGVLAPVIQVRIRHGDLAYARHPVLVGHYLGDTIVSAEAALDQRLEGALSERMQLGLYPGRVGTHAPFFNQRDGAKPEGAVVVGLGQVGELTPSSLETGVRDALLDYALRIAYWTTGSRFGPADSVRSAKVSCLLVGSGAGGLPTADVVKSILRGALAAADRLPAAGLHERVALDQLEFLEIYQDLAIGAAEALDAALRDDQLAARVQWPRRVIEEGEGGQRRVRCDEAPDWWQRLDIIQDPGDQALRFIATTDRARAEVTLAVGQLRLADGFIAQASRSAAANAEAAKTLFEMLLPNRLRELAPQQRDLVILVDEVSARYPWELLEDRWSHTGRPPAVAAGMVRQLKTPEYRTLPAHALEAKALVVGNPDLGGWDKFPDLPGARDEAVRVAELLRGAGYQVIDRIGEKADSILEGLHRDAWRILHLAGHGEHEFPMTQPPSPNCPACGQAPPVRTERLSGMVIGKDSFLTPGDVEQMRWVPELVFINCCHLGKTLRANPPPYGILAANLAVQFIRMGVKAVIAAGWAVDDRAGLAFADAFYSALLGGAPFGEAQRSARESIWLRFPEVNTWGAYQCYGDPAFRLRRGSDAETRPPRPPYRAPFELIADLANMEARIGVQVRAQGDDPQTLAPLRAGIDDLLAAIPDTEREDWLARADLAAALGFAWGETRAYAEAVTCLERALSAEQGDCPLRALERCNEFQVRLIGEDWRALRNTPAGDPKEDARHALITRLDQAIADLGQICDRAPTVERLALMGQACGQLAWLQDDPQARLEALGNMANYLERALERRPEPDPYHFPRWAAAKRLARSPAARPDGDWQTELADQLRAMGERAVALNEKEPSFRNAVARADNETVALLLLDGAPPEGTAGRIADLYREVLRRGASPRELDEVHDSLDFLIALGDGSPALETLQAIRKAL